MFTFAFYNQKMPNICHTKIILFKSYVSNISVSSMDSFFSFYIKGDIYFRSIL